MAVAISMRVYYEDTDASGVVYHAAYLRYFERARTEWLRSAGLSNRVMMERFAVTFTVASLTIDYLRPARLDDCLSVVAEVAEMRRASLTFEEQVHRVGQTLPLSRARVRVACVDMERFRPCSLPTVLRTYLRDHPADSVPSTADQEHSEA